MKATAIANVNIALVKYWGKRDKKLFLPNNSSMSLTLDSLNTTTTVEFGNYENDTFILDGKEIQGKELEKVTRHVELIRKVSGIQKKAKIVSKNNFPTAAGLASSASGFAALTLAATKAAGLDLNPKELSIISRQGSGSSTRSCVGGFVEWLKGNKDDGTDSYAKQVASPEYWSEFRMIITIVSTEVKKVSSRAGMAQTVETSLMYPVWLDTVEKDLESMRKGILNKDFTLVGTTAESSCLKMHATMTTTQPSIIYWMPATLEIIHAVKSWRENGFETYFTIDAGPQVKIIALENQVSEIKKKLQDLSGVKDVIVCKPGQGSELIENHLF
ncbi:MAG: diphosphomevalonate decarboxylase [Patescibacteria group bacterium]|nr:diphosphomevalonate decarboxylase [Patescibacteria group bacterium]